MFVARQSATSPTSFKFNDAITVRAISRNDEAWFVAVDVAHALEYRDAANLARILDDDEKDTHPVSTLGGAQKMLVINEPGLYHAIVKSRKPEAKAFRKWVTGTVLPAIRKTGRYEAPSTPPADSAPYLDVALAILDRNTPHLANQRYLVAFDSVGKCYTIKPLQPDVCVMTPWQFLNALGEPNGLLCGVETDVFFEVVDRFQRLIRGRCAPVVGRKEPTAR